MAEKKDKLLPGTVTTYVEPGEKGFSKISMLLDATGGLSLSQVCAVTGLEASTIQNWVKRGWVSHPKGKKYEEVHIARILIINALKECIKLEHIALLMTYVNGTADAAGSGIIKESEMFNYLCEALQKTGQEDDLSRSGVEAVVERVIKDYRGPTADSRVRIRKALALMIYACVCTDVKRRTEAMMEQILDDLDHPENIAAEAAAEVVEPEPEIIVEAEPEPVAEARKTVSQALREWDMGATERIISEYDSYDREEKAKAKAKADETATKAEPEEKPSYRPWYFRKNTKN